MKTYELTYIVSPETTSEEAGAKAKEIESVISGKDGTVLKQYNPVARVLSYPIKKHASGFFGILEFRLEPEKLVELKEYLQNPPAGGGKIVRHMVIIKQAAEMRKEKRTRTKPTPTFEIEKKTGVKETPEPASRPEGYPNFGVAKKEKPTAKTAGKEKVELKDIEEELDEILGK